MSDVNPAVSSFRDLNLPAPLLAALDGVGHETPSPIQAETIPCLLEGLDLLGHAPTGTGKTAAFALAVFWRGKGCWIGMPRTAISPRMLRKRSR